MDYGYYKISGKRNNLRQVHILLTQLHIDSVDNGTHLIVYLLNLSELNLLRNRCKIYECTYEQL